MLLTLCFLEPEQREECLHEVNPYKETEVLLLANNSYHPKYQESRIALIKKIGPSRPQESW